MTTDTSTTGTTTTGAQGTTSTAADEGRHVAGVAADAARSVAAEAGQQVRSVVDDAKTEVRGQLEHQGREQKDRIAGTLSTFGDDLSRMADGSSGLAADVAHEVADRVRAISRHLDAREPAELLEELRRFARQRPGTFLLGALAAGVVAGRLSRGTKDAIEAAEAEDRSLVSAGTGSMPVSGSQLSTPGTGTPPPSLTGYHAPPVEADLPPALTDEGDMGRTP